MQWTNPIAIGNLQLWKQLLGDPQVLSSTAGGYATWTTGGMGNRSFLGRPVPFSAVSIFDRRDKTIVVQLRLPLSEADSTRMQRVDVNLLSYDPSSKTVTVMNDNLVGLVALLILIQRIQLGSLASNAVFGAYISLAQSLRSGGQPDMSKIRGMYQEWYDRLGPATIAPGSATTAQERFSLGLPRRERMGSVSELVSAQRQFDRMTQDGLLRREHMSYGANADTLRALSAAPARERMTYAANADTLRALSAAPAAAPRRERMSYDANTDTLRALSAAPRRERMAYAANADTLRALSASSAAPRRERMAYAANADTLRSLSAASAAPRREHMGYDGNTSVLRALAAAPASSTSALAPRPHREHLLADSVYNQFLVPPTSASGARAERLSNMVEDNLQSLLNA